MIRKIMLEAMTTLHANMSAAEIFEKWKQNIRRGSIKMLKRPRRCRYLTLSTTFASNSLLKWLINMKTKKVTRINEKTRINGITRINERTRRN